MSDSSHPHLLGMLAGLFWATGLILFVMLATRAWMKIVDSQVITVAMVVTATFLTK